MANTIRRNKTNWYTLHKTGPFDLKALYLTMLEGENNMPDKRDRYNDTASEIRRLLKEALDAGEGFRSFGSKWSFSKVAHQKDRMHYGFLNLHLPLEQEDIHADTNYRQDNLFFFQGGNSIKEISQTLSEHGKSLKTSGASNGQTIAGCISTGVHGSAIDVGSIQDYVVGINLIIGPTPEDVIYLEPASKPGLSDHFAQKIASRVIRKDELFYAALVGLGSFGFVHGVAIEAEDNFLLRRYVRKINQNLALELADKLNFETSEFKIEDEVDEQGNGLRPHHYKIFINPYIEEPADELEYVVETMYKKPYIEPYSDPFPVIKDSIYKDLIYLLIKISEKFPKSIPWFLKQLETAILPEVNEDTTGTHAEIFWDAPYQGPAFACSFGVAHEDSSRTLEVLTKLVRKEGPFPGIFAMRFVKQSKATLAFSRFPITCMIEIDGIQWKKSKKLISLEEMSTRMIEVLQESNIPFTIHWGKNAKWDFPDLVKTMYGKDADSWKAIREGFLSPEMAHVFSNDFLDTLGLSPSSKGEA